MKYLRKFNESVGSNFPTTHADITETCKLFGLRPSKIHTDGTVDFDGNVDLRKGSQLDRLPLKFGFVKGNFNASALGLKTLEGSPITVGGDFIISENDLIDLKGAPEEVMGSVDIHKNSSLTSLEGIPKRIGSDISVWGCEAIWDFRPLKDVYFDEVGKIDEDSFIYTSAYPLIQIFGGMKSFLDSLPFNYIRKPIILHGSRVHSFNLFRFKEALEDADIEMKQFEDDYPYSFNKWRYVDEDGIRVDFDGNPI